MTVAPIIEVEHLAKSFGSVQVLSDVSFEVEQGETLCILGGSGGGKSTLLKMLIGAERPTRGKVVIDGQDTTGFGERQWNEVRGKLGVMFQGGALLNSMSIAENVALPLSYHTEHDDETIATIVKIKLHQVDLLHAADRRPSEISGGMQKRAAIARALALDPKILFYDEPSSGLDPIATSLIDQLINRLKETMGVTNVVVTHVVESVKRIADHVVMLDRGEVLVDGDLDGLMESTDPRVRQFRNGELEGPVVGTDKPEEYLRDLLM